MFDSLHTIRGLGAWDGCDNHRARAEQAEQQYHTLELQIRNYEHTLRLLKNGESQKRYEQLREQQDALLIEKGQLEVKLKQAKLVLEAWRTSPDVQFNAEGLGGLGNWFKKQWNSLKRDVNNAITCDRYTERQVEWERKSTPLSNRVAELMTDIKNERAKLSPENMRLQTEAVQKLNEAISSLKIELQNVEKQIAEHRQSYIVRKDAEKLALQQEAEEERKKLANKQEENSMDNFATRTTQPSGNWQPSGNTRPINNWSQNRGFSLFNRPPAAPQEDNNNTLLFGGLIFVLAGAYIMFGKGEKVKKTTA
ncbi:hypothetical protein [Capnocytophaga canis]|uniref:hypothetical protein n=1 Tax=Capnocytophaga canis TaxID=1848903 RepID=UPI001561B91A|nr:hypothetical protein [Capnocytophaga canis]